MKTKLPPNIKNAIRLSLSLPSEITPPLAATSTHIGGAKGEGSHRGVRAQSKTSRRTCETPRGSADESQEPGRRGGNGSIVHGESGAAAHTNGTGNGGAVQGKGNSTATAARTGAALSHTQTHTCTAIQYSPGSAQVFVYICIFIYMYIYIYIYIYMYIYIYVYIYIRVYVQT